MHEVIFTPMQLVRPHMVATTGPKLLLRSQPGTCVGESVLLVLVKTNSCRLTDTAHKSSIMPFGGRYIEQPVTPFTLDLTLTFEQLEERRLVFVQSARRRQHPILILQYV